MYFSWEHPPKTKESMAEVDGVARVEMVRRKTQREDRETALLLADIFLSVRKNLERERERERERELFGREYVALERIYVRE
jgi:hypothetical protein